jgi:hypothetical protein
VRRHLAVLIATASATCAASAQPFVWTNPAGGNWNDPSNWSPALVPNGPTQSAQVELLGTYIVDMDMSPTLLGLSISNPGATLRLLAGTTLTLEGPTFSNAGLVIVNPISQNARTVVQCSSDCEIVGAGTLQLRATGANGESALLRTNGGSARVTNRSTISGYGKITAILTNEGLISTSGPGRQMQFIGASQVNNGLILATDSATNYLATPFMHQGPGGIIRADNATNLVLASIYGGRIEAVNGGRTLLPIVPGALLYPADTSSGPVLIEPGATVRATGIHHDGIITINSTGASQETVLRAFSDTTVLSGDAQDCTIVLNGRPDDLQTAQIRTDSSEDFRFVVEPSCVITGTGRITADLTNNSIISARGASGIIEYTGLIKHNNGTILATDGGTNVIRCAITQGPDGVIRADAATTLIASSQITNGRIEAVNGGVTAIRDATAFFPNTRTSGPMIVTNSTLYLASDHVHDGDLIVNYPSSVTLGGVLGGGSGRCSILLNGHPDNPAGTRIAVPTPTGVLTIDPSCTIQGCGKLVGNFINNTTITCRGPGQRFVYELGTMTNNGTMLATDGASMEISGDVSQSSSGRIIADNLDLGSGSLSGGSLEISPGGRIAIDGYMRWNLGTPTKGQAQVRPGKTLAFFGATSTHDGIITLEPTASLPTALRFETTTVFGGGTGHAHVMLNDPSAQIWGTPGASVVFDATSKISGIGRILIPCTVAGQLSPGTSPIATGFFELQAPMTLSDTARLSIKVRTADPLAVDRLTSTQPISLGGTLKVSLLPSYSPTLGDSIRFIQASALSGTFFSTELPPLVGTPYKFRVQYTATQARLRVVCKADFNNDSTIDFFDYLDFVASFALEDPPADLDGNGQVDFFDYLDFVQAFDAGCE